MASGPHLLSERKSHKHEQMWGTVPGLGGWQNCVYVSFGGSFFMGTEKRIDKHLEIPQQSHEEHCVCVCVFF